MSLSHFFVTADMKSYSTKILYNFICKFNERNLHAETLLLNKRYAFNVFFIIAYVAKISDCDIK